MTSGGLRTHFERELHELDEMLLELGARSRRAVADAIQALNDGNPGLAREVIAGDQEINQLRFTIEKKVYALMATESPVARDLRQIVAGLVVVLELERIADHGKKIAKTYLRMEDDPRPLPAGSILQLAQEALNLLDRALRAFANRDSGAATAICRADDQVDALYRQTFNILIEHMLEDPRTIGSATHLMGVAHELERIGDRATNIAERTIYSVTGELTELNQ